MSIRKKFFQRKVTVEHRINQDIRAQQVRLVGEHGSDIMTIEEALAKATSENCDLVEIVKDQKVPVVKIIDYGKFKFDKSKKEKAKKRNQKITHLKEVKLGPKIDSHDFERKCHISRKFLESGDAVKVTMRFRGREMAHTELGLEKLIQLAENIQDVSNIEKKPTLEGRSMTMVIRPVMQNTKK